MAAIEMRDMERGALGKELAVAREAVEAAAGRTSLAREHLEHTRVSYEAARSTAAALEAVSAAAVSKERALDEGAAAVKGALDVTAVGDHLEGREPWETAAVADRAAYPVLADIEQVLEAALLARKRGPTGVVFAPSLQPVERLLASVAVVGTLHEDLALHLETGGPALVRGTGERVQADGTVLLGERGGALVARRAREQAQREFEDASQVANHASTALAAAIQLAQQAETAEQEARAGLGVATRRAEAREQAAVNRFAAAIDAGRREADALVAGEVVEAAAERRRRGVELRSVLDDERAIAAQERSRVLGVLRRSAEVEQQEAEFERAARVAQVATEALATVDGERAELALRVTEARVQVDSTRAASSTVEQAGNERIAVARADVASASAHHDDCRARLEARRAEASDVALALAGMEGRLAATEARLAEHRTRREQLRARIGSLSDELRDCQVAVTSTRELVEAASTALGDAAAAAEVAQIAEARVEAAESDARARLADARVLLATVRERLAGAQSSRGNAIRRADEATTRASRAQSSIDALSIERTGAVAKLHVAQGQLAQATQERAQAWDKLQRERQRLTAIRDALRDAEGNHQALVERREAARTKVHDLDAKVRDVRVAIDAVRDRMEERYQVSLAGLLDRLDAAGHIQLEPDPAVTTPIEVGGQRVEPVLPVLIHPATLVDEEKIKQLVEDIATWRQKLLRIGEVNLAALDEYREVQVRHDDLVTQRADLEDSVARIRTAIAKMNRTCRQRFRDAFDRVNEHFQVLYPRLVGGGCARLSLTDEEDLLETGVDIFVQPPGKRLQNLSLLSGGEKAMTAIALIMALFQVKPSPFCLLDEVDAPLDEANGARFNEMLREMASVAQFVLITHNRKTMECADVLYGVTMPNPGVSRLVSVQIEP
jgi:chromosome segregation protein